MRKRWEGGGANQCLCHLLLLGTFIIFLTANVSTICCFGYLKFYGLIMEKSGKVFYCRVTKIFRRRFYRNVSGVVLFQQ